MKGQRAALKDFGNPRSSSPRRPRASPSKSVPRDEAEAQDAYRRDHIATSHGARRSQPSIVHGVPSTDNGSSLSRQDELSPSH
jgi:hypothetical protein